MNIKYVFAIAAALAIGGAAAADTGALTQGPPVRLAENPNAFEVRACFARHADLRIRVGGSMRCTMSAEGRLTDCDFPSLTTRTPQIESAFRCVASHYRVVPRSAGGAVPAGEEFTLPVQFMGSVPTG